MWPSLRQGTMSHWGCGLQALTHSSHLPRLLTNVTAVSPTAPVSRSEAWHEARFSSGVLCSQKTAPPQVNYFPWERERCRDPALGGRQA